MKLLFVTSELAPLHSTGGLAYVSQSYPRQLRGAGVDARVLAPCVPAVHTRLGTLPECLRLDFELGGRRITGRVLEWREPEGGNWVYWVDLPEFFARERLYGHADEALRWVAFNHAALELLRAGVFAPHLLHGNDWFCGALLHALRQEAGWRGKTVLSIRNLRYQGVFPATQAAELGLDWPTLCAAGLDFYGQLNLLRLGLRAADLLLTSSPSYAQEIQQLDHDPLSPELAARGAALQGVLEGLDLSLDNPETDPRLACCYGRAEAAAGKAANKRALQAALGWPDAPQRPLLAWINRLTSQKGVDLLRLALGQGLLAEDLQLMLCADGDPLYEREFRELAAAHPAQLVYRPYDEALAYRLYAASDLYLMPSTYEPGGIAQLIAMRYGSLPLVRATGGLRDTVQPYDPASGTGTGFSFDYRNAWLMLQRLREALALYRQQPETWARLRQQAMQHDCSWAGPLARSLQLYRSLL